MKRIGVIGIIIKNNRDAAVEVQKTISEYGDIILGRMGVPHRINNIYAISVIVEGSNETISALTGKLGRINNVSIKSAITTIEVEEK